MRKRADWMTQLDDEILELLDSSDLILSPSIIAINIDRSREGVAHRLSTLSEYGLIEKIDRGKYVITENGSKYLNGEFDASNLSSR